jgi:hypothetical protein
MQVIVIAVKLQDEKCPKTNTFQKKTSFLTTDETYF